MVGGHLDQDHHQTVRISNAELDQAPRFLNRAFDDRHRGGAQLSFRLAHIPHLKPELCRRRGRLDLLVGDLQEPAAQEEDDPARSAVAKLAHRVKAEGVPVEGHAAVEVARVKNETAGKYLHRARDSDLTLSGAQRRVYLT